ncbi:MAG: ORF6N domain-containing protein [Deltaproteobacteria bacterium]|nr:ORF6N domain-containing protein [Deltaproteobacteria bacterium]
MQKEIIKIESIEKYILLIRGQKVMLDHDLAALYGVSTKRLKEQVRRNYDRFPSEFMFELSESEKAEVVAKCDHLKKLKYSPYLPFAFTEYGALMLANVLNSTKAVQVSVQIIRTFVRLREMMLSNNDLACKLAELEKRYDSHFKAVFIAIRQLLEGPEKAKRKIGFRVEEPNGRYVAHKKRG